MTTGLTDQLNRPLHDLRISVTDRCNFRCGYCMPIEMFGHDHHFLGREELLNFEEIERLVRIFVEHGVQKIRLTGGEPLLRKELENLIRLLAAIPKIDVTLTTNGTFLADQAKRLKEAGLKRITVSLDSLDEVTFAAMNDVNFPLQGVLDGIEAAEAVGLASIKINMVVKRGVNDTSILPMARYFREKGHILRFIEFMDVGTTNGWALDQVVSASEILKSINAEMPLEPIDPSYRGEVAKRWRYKDGSGEIGVVASVTQPFCSDCSRARLSADGILYTCLFASGGHNLRGLLRGGSSDEEVSLILTSLWEARKDRYSEIRSSDTVNLPKVEMSYIGG